MRDESRIVVVADSGRGRVYALEPEEKQGSTNIPPLREVASMVNSSRRLRDDEVFSESRPGLRQGAAGVSVHGVDDRRDSHKDELDRRFAGDIVDKVLEVTRGLGAKRIVLAASPHMLGHLRSRTAKWSESGYEVEELARDLTQLTPAQLHDRLAEEELIPPRSRYGQHG
jgi:protein required for attachment to host cells